MASFPSSLVGFWGFHSYMHLFPFRKLVVTCSLCLVLCMECCIPLGVQWNFFEVNKHVHHSHYGLLPLSGQYNVDNQQWTWKRSSSGLLLQSFTQWMTLHLVWLHVKYLLSIYFWLHTSDCLDCGDKNHVWELHTRTVIKSYMSFYIQCTLYMSPCASSYGYM